MSTSGPVTIVMPVNTAPNETVMLVRAGGSASSFIDLPDAPHSYSG